MIFMAGAGLALALYTQHTRREHDRRLPIEYQVGRIKRNTAPPVADVPAPTHTEHYPPLDYPTPPLQLAALGYLPGDVNVLAAVHVAELLRLPGGRQWFDQPLSVGGVEIPLTNLAAWTGVPRDELDHVVLGVAIPPNLGRAVALPRVYLLVRTLHPYRLSEVLTQLQHGDVIKATEAPPRTLYQVRLPTPAGKVWLWNADERTLIVSLLGDDTLEKVPFRPAPRGGQLMEEIRSGLVDRVGSPAPLWMIGHLDRPLPLGEPASASKDAKDKLAGLKGLTGWLALLKDVKTAAVWLEGERLTATPGPGLVLGSLCWVGEAGGRGDSLLFRASCHCRSVEAAAALEKSLRGAQPNLSVERDDTWTSLRWPTDRAALRKLLSK
jgi:hypothetical protein